MDKRGYTPAFFRHKVVAWNMHFSAPDVWTYGGMASDIPRYTVWTNGEKFRNTWIASRVFFCPGYYPKIWQQPGHVVRPAFSSVLSDRETILKAHESW